MRALALVLSISASSALAAEPLGDAREIARWLTSCGRDVTGGRVWPVDPKKPEEVVAHLYSGTLRLHAFEKGEKGEPTGLSLPDSPFPP